MWRISLKAPTHYRDGPTMRLAAKPMKDREIREQTKTRKNNSLRYVQSNHARQLIPYICVFDN